MKRLIIKILLPDLGYVLESLLSDSKENAEEYGRDYNNYEYVKKAKTYLNYFKDCTPLVREKRSSRPRVHPAPQCANYDLQA